MIITAAAKQAMLAGLQSRLNQNANIAQLKLYDSADALLASVDIDSTVGTISTATLTFKPTDNYTVIKTGTVATGKIIADDDVVLFSDLTVKKIDDTATAAPISLDVLEVQAGGIINVGAITFSF